MKNVTKKKVLFVATVVKTHINVFHLPMLEQFKNNGWETWVAARNDFPIKEDCNIPFCDVYVDMPFARNPFMPQNIKVYKALKKLIDKEQFDIISCHTPVGGVLARLAAAKARKKGTKVVYTAHGFHFFRGAPKQNWLLFYPIEKFCSRYTDTLVTINREDFNIAKRKMHAKRVEHVPGVGIYTERIIATTVDVNSKRKDLGIPEDAFLLLSIGELNANKNHKAVIKALDELRLPNVHYAIAGGGDQKETLEAIAAECGLSENVHFLGFRHDIYDLIKIADAYAHPSFREGLPVSVMEAMAGGLPCVVSNVRGNADLIADGEGGYLCSPTDTKGFARAIEMLVNAPEMRAKMGKKNAENIRNYDISVVNDKLIKIYSAEFEGEIFE